MNEPLEFVVHADLAAEIRDNLPKPPKKELTREDIDRIAGVFGLCDTFQDEVIWYDGPLYDFAYAIIEAHTKLTSS